jgi:hypothetical protein
MATKTERQRKEKRMTTTMTPEQLQAAALARRERLLKFHTAYLAEAREAAPTWLDAMDEMHEVIHDPQACELLAESAPDDGYLRGYWMGRAAALHSISALTARSVDC